MADTRYFIPDHPSLKGVYSKDDLRGLLHAGRVSRSDIVFDDETGLSHLLGDLLMMPYRGMSEGRHDPEEDQDAGEDETDDPVREHEFRAHTPLAGRKQDASAADLAGEMPEDYPEETYSPGYAGEHESQGQNGEELLYLGHPSWLAYPRSVLGLFAFGGAAWLFYFFHADMAWVVVSAALALLPVLFVALDRTTTTYFITSRRVELEFGIIGRSTKEVRISDIRAIDVVQEGYDAVAGIGNVKFDSAAGPASEVEFNHVRRPHEIKQLVRELQG